MVIQSLEAQIVTVRKALQESESTLQEEMMEVQEKLAHMTGRVYDLQVC